MEIVIFDFKTDTIKSMITKDQILEFQDKWGSGIIRIGKTYKDGGDVLNEAKDFISRLYAYETETVFFKPTLASHIQFRLDKDAALSYFIGGNLDFPEDEGFAIKEWDSISWDNVGIKIDVDTAICMGNYYFGKENEEDLKVEYSIVLKISDSGLKMILHDSHLPYQK